jgi:tetratricopeptide (TPR) repeat protein
MYSEEQLISRLAEVNPGAAALARVVSLAVLIEPQLLRRARLSLLKDVDTGAEADLWLSPLVQTRSPRGITLAPRVAARLRRELAATPDLFNDAWKLTQEVHRGAPPTITLEEKINRLSAKLDARALGEIEALLRSVANTLVLDEERSGLANWAASALPRLPPEVRQLESARILAGAAYLRLSAYLPPEKAAPSQELPEWIAWALPKDLPKVGLGMQLVEGGVRVGGSAPPSHTIQLPRTNPLLVELSWLEDRQRHVRQLRLTQDERRTIKVPLTEIHLRTAQGARYIITPGDAVEIEEPSAESDDRKTCFVVMGFGQKVDFQTGRKLNLDASYHNMIKPAVESAGLKCIRADEIVQTAVIDVPTYEYLLTADVVIADLSTYNPNAFYELGVRHGLRPFSTIIIAEDSLNYPFDVSLIAIRRYRHLGEDISVGDARKFSMELKQALDLILEKQEIDSPVYQYLTLIPPTLSESPQDTARAASAPVDTEARPAPRQTHSALMESANEAIRVGDFATAKSILSNLRWTFKRADPNSPEDPYMVQRLALVTYKSKQPTPRDALEEARSLLATLDPATSNDTETLGLWGAVHKRLWDLTGEVAQLDEAVRAYGRGFHLRNDYYNGINLAYLLNVRAAQAGGPAEAITDFVQAKRVRREVLAVCETVLLNESLEDEQKYWLLAAMAEAHLGLGDEQASAQRLEAAFAAAPSQWMRDATREQMDKLRPFLADSPLRLIRVNVS